VGFKKGPNGHFWMDNKPIKFQFKLKETHDDLPMDGVDVSQLPNYIAEASPITYIANKETDFVSPA
jgi:hypothetical protein